jgi:ribose 5-phosphate isomerase B
MNETNPIAGKPPITVGLAADHGGYELKQQLVSLLREAGHHVVDFGNHSFQPDDDYPDFVIPLARAVAAGKMDRGIALCGSGVGVCVTANKIAGVRACLIHETYAAHQGVEDDDLNLICLGGQTVGLAEACELVRTFLTASFKGEERFRRRLAKVAELETYSPKDQSEKLAVLPGIRPPPDRVRVTMKGDIGALPVALREPTVREEVESWENEGDPN